MTFLRASSDISTFLSRSALVLGDGEFCCFSAINECRYWQSSHTKLHNCASPLTTASTSNCSLGSIKPKFHYNYFHQNFPAGKVVDTYYESCGLKWWKIMKSWSFGKNRRHKSWKSQTQTISTQSVTSQRQTHLCRSNGIRTLQYTEKVGDKVHDTNHESPRHLSLIHISEPTRPY